MHDLKYFKETKYTFEISIKYLNIFSYIITLYMDSYSCGVMYKCACMATIKYTYVNLLFCCLYYCRLILNTPPHHFEMPRYAHVTHEVCKHIGSLQNMFLKCFKPF